MIKHKRHIVLAILAVLLGAFVLWVILGNTVLETTAYSVTSDTLPDTFDGFRIAQVSDLHNAGMGPDNERLLSALRDAKPDIIVITGDLVDSRRTDLDVALQFAKNAMEIAPCYYVTGNHEARIEEYPVLKAGLIKRGVVVLEDEKLTLERAGEVITLVGVQDPSFKTDYLFGDEEGVMNAQLQALLDKTDGYTVLLSHRPELLATYAAFGVDLVLSGHAHGGQFRLPFVGGLFAPDQGLFPTYDAGMFTQGSTCMVISRGIGNSLFPFRMGNRPELVVIQLAVRGQDANNQQ